MEFDRKMEELAEKIVRDKAPEFWQDFLREIESTVKSFREAGTLRASVDKLTGPSNPEAVSVFFGSNSVVFRLETCHIFYSKFDRTIQGLRGDGTAFRLTFHLDDDHKVCVMATDRPYPMNVEAAGQYVMEPMVERLSKFL